MRKEQELFIPRDFIYINQDKLDSYFSQLFGGLIQTVDISDIENEQRGRSGTIDAEAAGKFGIGKGSVKLLDFMLSHIGNLDLSLKGNIGGEINKSFTTGSSITSKKTLQHFQYSLFEESLIGSGYLIDLDQVNHDAKLDAGQFKEKLEVSNFIKFKATSIEISDYRNAKNFVGLFTKFIELFTNYMYGELLDSTDKLEIFGMDNDEEQMKKLALSMIANKFTNGSLTIGSGERFKSIIEIINKIFSGELIPLDVLLTSKFNVGKRGQLVFESQIKDKYLLEERTDLSYKYGFFEDTNWTIVGQVTSLKAPTPYKIDETFSQFTDNLTGLFSKGKELDINQAVKSMIKEIDLLNKKMGLLPLVSEGSIAITPIAIFSEPSINSSFNK